MNITEMSNYSSLPGALFRQVPCISNLPFNAEIFDDWSRVGSGIGNEKSSVNSALGEYFERRHFYSEIFPEKKQKLQTSLKEIEMEYFILAFSQTALNSAKPNEIRDHDFGTTAVTRISDFSRCDIPTCLISIGYQQGESDWHIYPSRDTCGCSFHASAEHSIFGAIKESLERQFLVRFWLTKKCNTRLSLEEIDVNLIHSPVYPLYKALCKAGQIAAVDISDHHFPGVCTLVIYGCPDKNRSVQFGAGMAYSETLAAALEKSIYELWQTFRFMDLFACLNLNPSDLKDPYLRHFLSCNKYETYQTLMDIKYSDCSYSPTSAAFNTSSLIAALSHIDIEGYLYTKMQNISGHYFTFSKFISPSLFLHMDNSKNINLNNKFSSAFLKDIYPERQSTMVPFP